MKRRTIKERVKRLLPPPVVDALRKVRRTAPRSIDLGDLRRTKPVDKGWGYGRGRPIGRYYIERFMEASRDSIRGRCLEIGEDLYSSKYGGGGVKSVDVLHVESGHPGTTIVADLQDAPHVPSGRFDAIVLTQTLQNLYDVRAGVRTLHRILRPHGVVLITVPCLSKVSRYDADRWGDFWRFTPLALQRALAEVFGPENVEVTSFGNVLSATAGLYGLAAEDLSERELDVQDPDYPVMVAARAVKTTFEP